MFCLSMQHRNERRGLGGIFFDDLNDYDQEMLLNFATGEAFC
jgi:coproporphyrinogen III oxidase